MNYPLFLVGTLHLCQRLTDFLNFIMSSILEQFIFLKQNDDKINRAAKRAQTPYPSSRELIINQTSLPGTPYR